MNLDHDTLAALDWPVVVEALAEGARTAMGKAAVRALQPLPDAAAVRACHDVTDELLTLRELGEDVPIGGVSDVAELVRGAAKARVLEGPELRLVGNTLGALRELAWFLVRHAEDTPRLWAIGEHILVDDVLADELLVAFENTGELSARTYPELGELRQRIADLHSAIRETLGRLLKSDDMQDLLQDTFVTQRNDRYVLPIKAHAKRWDLGIVHGTSGSGQTAYIEPAEVVSLNNRLRIAEGELKAAERRILTRLSAEVGREAPQILDDLQAATVLDVHVARRALAERLEMTRPQVGDQGAIELVAARHPVLALRGVKVIGNDLGVSAATPALVLSGPNAGGKTVSLKTVGLCALLVRIGCFVPAEEGSRVDLFHTVLAAIGDAQSVEGDLSSFSGHLLVLSEMYERAAPGALLLLDEIASGTDPAEGAPLAQAVLERMLEQGPRLVITTHFARLKLLPAADGRFASAAVEYAEGRPTYRVVAGALGQSHALSIAKEMGLSDQVLDRARALMADGEAGLAETLAGLDEATRAAEAARREAEAARKALEAREAEVKKREEALRTRVKQLEDQAAAGFRERVAKAEKAIAAVVADLQQGPSHKKVAAAKATVGALRGVVPEVEDEEAPEGPRELQVGDPVRLRGMGSHGEVVGISGDQLQVRTGAVTLRVERSQVERMQPEATPQHARKIRKKVHQRQVKTAAPTVTPLDEALRMPGNTVDLRGQRVEEGLDAVEAFLDQALMRGHDTIFVLHGHGTGAMKQAVRQMLGRSARVSTWAPANADQGGDAYTVARVAR